MIAYSGTSVDFPESSDSVVRLQSPAFAVVGDYQLAAVGVTDIQETNVFPKDGWTVIRTDYDYGSGVRQYILGRFFDGKSLSSKLYLQGGTHSGVIVVSYSGVSQYPYFTATGRGSRYPSGGNISQAVSFVELSPLWLSPGQMLVMFASISRQSVVSTPPNMTARVTAGTAPVIFCGEQLNTGSGLVSAAPVVGLDDKDYWAVSGVILNPA